jgi:thymidylate synthase ThyX
LRSVHNADIKLDNCFVPNKNKLTHAKDFATGTNAILEASRLLTFNCLIETPLFVFNQLVKHRKAEVNTRSYRYVKDAELEFYQPKKWRKQSENNKSFLFFFLFSLNFLFMQKFAHIVCEHKRLK